MRFLNHLTGAAGLVGKRDLGIVAGTDLTAKDTP